MSSGSATIYTLSRSKSGAFTVSDSPAPVSVDTASHPLPSGSFVIDAKTGARVTADRQGLAAVIEASSGQDVGRRVMWVSTGTKGARCVADLDGEKLGSVSWPSKAGTVVGVDIVEKNGMTTLSLYRISRITDTSCAVGGCALVVFTDLAEALVYSLPFLEHLHSLQLPHTSLSYVTRPPAHITRAHAHHLHRRVSADSTGDYLTHVLDPATGIARQTIYGTLFATRRVAPYAAPSVDFMVGRGSVPAQPAPVPLEPQTVIGSVLGYLGRGVTTGAEIDALRTCSALVRLGGAMLMVTCVFSGGSG